MAHCSLVVVPALEIKSIFHTKVKWTNDDSNLRLIFFPFLQPGSTEIPDTFFIPETPLDGFVASNQMSKWNSCQPLSVHCTTGLLCTFNRANKHLVFVFLFLRDRPYLLYFDVIKCAASANAVSAGMNGLQCPTPQVELGWCRLTPPNCLMLNAVCTDISILNVEYSIIQNEAPLSVCCRCAWHNVPLVSLLWTLQNHHKRLSMKASACHPLTWPLSV